jgi:hypothetical protein
LFAGGRITAEERFVSEYKLRPVLPLEEKLEELAYKGGGIEIAKWFQRTDDGDGEVGRRHRNEWKASHCGWAAK